MKPAIELSQELIIAAEKAGGKSNCSTSDQIECWAQVGRTIDENHDLPPAFIKGLLTSLEEMEAGDIHPFDLDE